MTEYPGFDVLLKRLLDRRHLGRGELALRSRVAEAEIAAVLDGETPTPAAVLCLSSALDLRAVDLFAIAQLEPPDELLPFDPRAGRGIPQIVGSAIRLSQGMLAELRHHVRTLPRFDRAQPHASLRTREQYAPSTGAVVVRMLENRNLDWSTGARVLSRLASVHLSPATIGAIGHGRKDLNVDLLVAFAGVLGIPAADLMAIAAIEDPMTSSDRAQGSGSPVSELVWELRDLTVEQVRDVHKKAVSLMERS